MFTKESGNRVKRGYRERFARQLFDFLRKSLFLKWIHQWKATHLIIFYLCTIICTPERKFDYIVELDVINFNTFTSTNHQWFTFVGHKVSSPLHLNAYKDWKRLRDENPAIPHEPIAKHHQNILMLSLSAQKLELGGKEFFSRRFGNVIYNSINITRELLMNVANFKGVASRY